MKRKHIISLLYLATALLVLGFAIHVTVDGIRYNPCETSAPFYLTILLHGLCYLLPAVLTLTAALCVQRKSKQITGKEQY